MNTPSSNLSYVPLKIFLFYNDIELGCGTAFFYERNNKTYFVTNWHNVSGTDPNTGKVLHKQGGFPNRIYINFPFNNNGNIEWEKSGFNLEVNDEVIWYEHPVHGKKVDVAVIDLHRHDIEWFIFPDKLFSNAKQNKNLQFSFFPANKSGFSIRLQKEVGMDVFVLGFPLGWTGGAEYPIWKRASIASDPNLDLENLPKMYIDTATREGMSGSPVYAKASSNFFLEGADKFDPMQMMMGKAYQFLGIYSSRIGVTDEFSAQLGIVWKESVIQEIIDSINS